MKSHSINLTHSDYVEARKGLSWYKRFNEIGDLPLVDKQQKSSQGQLKAHQETVLLLRVHYKWFVKFLKRLLSLSLEDSRRSIECKRSIDSLMSTIDEIDDDQVLQHSIFRKISRKIKKSLVLPLPHSTSESIKVFAELQYITNELSLRLDSHNGNKHKRDLKLFLIQSEDARRMRHELSAFWSDVYSLEPLNVHDVNAIAEMKKFLEISCLGLQNPVKVGEALEKLKGVRDTEVTKIAANIQLWPVYEYMFLLFARGIQSELWQSLVPVGNDEASDILEKFSLIPSIPVNLIALLSAALECAYIDSSTDLQRLLPRLFSQIIAFSRNSLAIHDSQSMSQWAAVKRDQFEDALEIFEDGEIVQVNRLDTLFLKFLYKLIFLNLFFKNNPFIVTGGLFTEQFGTGESHERPAAEKVERLC